MALLHFHKATTFSLVHFLLFLALLSSSYIAQLPYFINCGSSNPITISDGQNFVGDAHPNQFHMSSHGRYIVKNRNYSADSLCQTARVFTKPSTYDFDIPLGIGFYILRFHFCEFSSDPELADAQFNVSASGYLLLSSFSLGKNTTDSSELVKEFFLTINSTTGKLRVYFQPSPSFAFVNALEVLSTKQNITEATGPHITNSGNRPTYNGPKSKVLETLYRINVGGSKTVDPNYWRTWIPDDPFLINQNEVKKSAPYTTGITYGVSGSATVDDAPNDVYSSAKQLNSTSIRHPNPIWQFNVSKGTTFFVRVHFCDIVSIARGPYVFNFYIYNKYVDHIEPYQEFGVLAVPFYKDYMVDSDDIGTLNISIGPVDNSSGLNRTYAFLNGLEIMQVKNGTAPEPLYDKTGSDLGHVIGLAGAGLVLVIILVVVALLCRKKRKTKPVEVEAEAEAFEWAMVPLHQGASCHNMTPDRSSSNPSNLSNLHLRLKIRFVEIQRATRNFHPDLIIGEGGFGKVYKGTLKNGKKVAVKRSNPDHGQGLLEFQAEIMILSKIRHRHLVSLIGYCNEEGEMILVYKFMEKGTLRDHLYGSKGSSVSSNPGGLSWKQRLEICIGAAKGLDYLHSGSDRGIIHRDVKSTNILLDENYVAEVADFGLSRLGQLDQTHVSTDVKGTFGYLDPEYFQCMQLTEKSDVYSFGVVLLEVLCARPVIDRSLPKEQVNLADWAMTCHEQGQLEKIIDPLLAGKINENSLKKFVEAAEKCLKENAVDRPPMSDVRWDLEYSLQLQKTATQRELLQDDSMADASFNLPLPAVQRFPSQSYAEEEDDVSLMNTSTGEVFSQLGFDDGR